MSRKKSSYTVNYLRADEDKFFGSPKINLLNDRSNLASSRTKKELKLFSLLKCAQRVA